MMRRRLALCAMKNRTREFTGVQVSNPHAVQPYMRLTSPQAAVLVPTGDALIKLLWSVLRRFARTRFERLLFAALPVSFTLTADTCTRRRAIRRNLG